MIYITGDCHGEFSRFSKKQRKNLSYEFTEGDYLIICGDFGLCWTEDAEFKYNCDWLSGLPFTILFVDGNHENHAMLAKYPAELWNGGKVHHVVKDKIIHLMRGQVFNIEGNTFFTFGGASSHDIQGGILDKKDPRYKELKRRAIKKKIPYRINGVSWWREELPSAEEIQEGLNNLEQMNFRVDYVITHCISNRIQDELIRFDIENSSDTRDQATDILTDYFDELEDKLQYKKWFCGHYHEDVHVDEKHIVLYKKLISIAEV